MIEIISSTACIACDVCIKVCPTDVFERGEDGIPVIARQSDCQTCFMCEAYCPVDALYVSPISAPVGPDSPHADEGAVRRARPARRVPRDGRLGPRTYRRRASGPQPAVESCSTAAGIATAGAGDPGGFPLGSSGGLTSLVRAAWPPPEGGR